MVKYPIFDGQKQVGEAVVRSEGMYRVVQCRCMPVSGKPQRICLRAGEQIVDLGLCVPDGNSMSLLKRMPAKVLDCGQLSIFVKEVAGEGMLFVPGQPFEHIHLLRDAKLQIREGRFYVVTSESSRPTGQ